MSAFLGKHQDIPLPSTDYSLLFSLSSGTAYLRTFTYPRPNGFPFGFLSKGKEPHHCNSVPKQLIIHHLTLSFSDLVLLDLAAPLHRPAVDSYQRAGKREFEL